jgi:hypothetical protein
MDGTAPRTSPGAIKPATYFPATLVLCFPTAPPPPSSALALPSLSPQCNNDGPFCCIGSFPMFLHHRYPSSQAPAPPRQVAVSSMRASGRCISASPPSSTAPSASLAACIRGTPPVQQLRRQAGTLPVSGADIFVNSGSAHVRDDSIVVRLPSASPIHP